MSLTPSREPGTGMEPKQVAGSKEGAPVTREKPLTSHGLNLSEGWRPPAPRSSLARQLLLVVGGLTLRSSSVPSLLSPLHWGTGKVATR